MPTSDLKQIDILYVRSVLEFICCVWHFDITQAERNEIERVQKVACKIILQDSYQSYENALETLDLENLTERRMNLCLNFAKRCLKFEKTLDMFPLNELNTNHTRSHEKFRVKHAKTDRLKNSAIPQMQRLLNSCWFLSEKISPTLDGGLFGEWLPSQKCHYKSYLNLNLLTVNLLTG